ncbi:MAG: hypothetical protein KGM43_19650 [Planctomycetota bacterium]|nr:hypothetical protein [Planctomycetota bacterium]
MNDDPKKPHAPVVKDRDKGLKIFSYPKFIFVFPTFVAALICGIGMSMIQEDTTDPIRVAKAELKKSPDTGVTVPTKIERFETKPNLFGVFFLGVFAFNMLFMALDFPRFTLIAVGLLGLFSLFFVLWLGAQFDLDLLRPVTAILGSVYAVANKGFYFAFAGIIAVLYAVVWVTRWLDYWEVMPNEILHHHGPLSDLERYPTLNLKFDKEIPDVLEFLFLGSGRLVMHVADERKSIVLENVLFINGKEEALKRIMGRLEVRVTTDKEMQQQ